MKSKSKLRAKKAKTRHGRAGVNLSLCMIVKDEGKSLEGCLQAIKPAVDEMIVVDTGSSDNTKEVALRLGAKVFDFPWCDDFSAARNESIRHASGKYILWLDADDRMDPREIDKLRQLKTSLSPVDLQAFYFIVKSEAQQQTGDLYFYQLRLFPNVPGARFEWRIHEQISSNLKKAGIPCQQRNITIRHVGNERKEDVVRKSLRNLIIIEAILQEAPDNYVMKFQLARTLANLERYEEAVTAMQQVVDDAEVKNNQRQIYLEASLLMARYCDEMGLDASAKQIYAELAKEFPDNSLVRYYLGALYVQMERFEEAVVELKQCTTVDFKVDFIPLNLDVIRAQRFFLLSTAYRQQGLFDLARDALVQTLDAPLFKVRALQELGLLGLLNGDYPQAIDYFNQAIAQEQGNTDANHTNLGLALLRANQVAEAEQAFRTALDINPDRVEALSNLGHLAFSKGDTIQAISCFNRVKLLDPSIADAKVALSEIYFRQNDIDKLLKECELLLKDVGLANNAVLDGLEDLAGLYGSIAEQLAKTDHPGAALMAYQLSVLIHPRPELMERMFTLAKALGQLESYRKYMTESIQRHNQNPEVLQSIQTSLQKIELQASSRL